MKNRHWDMTRAGIYGAGALTMYLLDPQQGRRRRNGWKDALVRSEHEVERFAGRFRRDFRHRVEGAIAETDNLLHGEPVSDEILKQRVRTALGRVVSHPHAMEVECKDGKVTLSGWVLAEEADNLEKMVETVRGVKEVSSCLNITDQPEHISALQGGRPRRRVPEFLREEWSPTARVLAGATALGLIGYGLFGRKPLGKGMRIAGSVLLGRSILNMPFRNLVGAGPGPSLMLQKAVRVRATPEELYSFWVNPENYPRAFPHIQEVTREEDGIYRWRILGPAGIPLSWTGTIVRQVPGKLVEWRSLRGSAIDNWGVIRLNPEKDGYTQVHVQMNYTPPGGLLGHAVAALIGVDPRSLMDREFVSLKTVFEQGRGQELSRPA